MQICPTTAINSSNFVNRTDNGTANLTLFITDNLHITTNFHTPHQ